MGKKKLDILKKNQINKKVNLALNWLTTSGIQNSDKRNKKQFGAFNAWFDTKSKKYSYMYSEITGYLITSMLFHYELTKKKIFLQSAKNCADCVLPGSISLLQLRFCTTRIDFFITAPILYYQD